MLWQVYEMAGYQTIRLLLAGRFWSSTHQMSLQRWHWKGHAPKMSCQQNVAAIGVAGYSSRV